MESLHQHADSWQGYIFSFDLSDDFNKSHKFTNFNFCDFTLRHAIGLFNRSTMSPWRHQNVIKLKKIRVLTKFPELHQLRTFTAIYIPTKKMHTFEIGTPLVVDIGESLLTFLDH